MELTPLDLLPVNANGLFDVKASVWRWHFSNG